MLFNITCVVVENNHFQYFPVEMHMASSLRKHKWQLSRHEQNVSSFKLHHVKWTTLGENIHPHPNLFNFWIEKKPYSQHKKIVEECAGHRNWYIFDSISSVEHRWKWCFNNLCTLWKGRSNANTVLPNLMFFFSPNFRFSRIINSWKVLFLPQCTN